MPFTDYTSHSEQNKLRYANFPLNSNCPYASNEVMSTSGIVTPFINFWTRLRRSMNCTPQPLYPRGKGSQQPLNERKNGTTAHLNAWQNEKNLFPLSATQIYFLGTKLSYYTSYFPVKWVLVKSAYNRMGRINLSLVLKTICCPLSCQWHL